MTDFSNTQIEQMIIHNIGDRIEEQGVVFSTRNVDLEDTFIRDLMLNYFLSAFEEQEYFRFFHDTDINYNDVFAYSSKIFENPETFIPNSRELASFLYKNSEHPKIKPGEFYTVLFKDCVLDDQVVQALGLFKTEKKDDFIKIDETDDNFKIKHHTGINLKKPDKACIIFNTEKEQGYILMVVDNLNKGKGAQYWRDNFLNVEQIENGHYLTQNHLQMCKNFVETQMKEADIKEQIEVKNQALKYFTEKENFEVQEFEKEVFTNPQTAQSFNDFSKKYSEETGFDLEKSFEISEDAVSKNKSKFKNIIKLDKNFHIYVHGNQELIDKGFDKEVNKSYYMLYYDQEL